MSSNRYHNQSSHSDCNPPPSSDNNQSPILQSPSPSSPPYSSHSSILQSPSPPSYSCRSPPVLHSPSPLSDSSELFTFHSPALASDLSVSSPPYQGASAPQERDSSQSQDHAGSQSQDHAGSQSQDHAGSQSQDHAGSQSQDPAQSPAIDRNPSPPPEILSNDKVLLPDRIGDSVYSKQWMYKTLMTIMKVFSNSEKMQVDSVPDSASGSVESDEEEINKMEELDPKIEEGACTLWDMSANIEVAAFLYECGVDIFLEAIDKTKSPRLLEIIIGILANMCAFDSTCEKISRKKNLLYAVIMLSGTSDSPTLLQVYRLINCGTSNKASQRYWFDALEENSYFMENLKFVLDKHLGNDVLKSALEVLDRILNECSSYCYMWGHQPYTYALITAADQLLKSGAYEELDHFFCVLNTLFQHAPNIKTYAENFEILQPLFIAYFQKTGGEETLPKVCRIPSVSCSFAVYGTILKCKDLNKELIIFDSAAMHSIYKLALSARNIIYNISRMEVEQSDSEDEDKDPHNVLIKLESKFHDWVMFLEAIAYGVNAMESFAKEENEKSMIEKISKALVTQCNA